jgi:hypothetical protein
MASTLRKLTGVGGDVRKIAALLQKKAPPGHKLAYINDEEADLLKSRGGSGKPHADTGIPSFQPDAFDTFADVPTETDTSGSAGGSPDAGALDVFSQQYSDVPASVGVQPAPVSTADTAAQAAALSSFPEIGTGAGTAASPFAARDIAAGEAALTAPAKPAASKEEGLSKDTLTRLGLAGGLGLLGARTAKQAAASGQAGAQQIQGLAAPYQKQGQELQAQAQRGELTPAAQQSLQAVQAQAAQAAQARGGVGAAQTQQQIEAYRQQLLAQQYDYGLKLSGIGDNIALGAIKTGLEADRYVQQLNNSFYTNMAYIASGMSPGIRVGGTT